MPSAVNMQHGHAKLTPAVSSWEHGVYWADVETLGSLDLDPRRLWPMDTLRYELTPRTARNHVVYMHDVPHRLPR